MQYAGVADVSLAEWFLSVDFVRFLNAVTGRWCRPSEGFVQFRMSDVTTPAFPVHVDAGEGTSFVSLSYLSPDWEPDHGGQLILHKSQESSSGAVIDPLPNRLVVFETAADHWHRVEKVRASERYSIMIEWLPLVRSGY